MCLILTVRLADADAGRAAEICRAAEIPSPPRKRWLLGSSTAPGTIQIPGPEGGCGCSFLADSADWSAPTWDMIPATLPRLVNVLRTIRAHSAGSFTFDAMWIGETPEETSRVTIDALVRLVNASRLGTRTRYVVD